MRPSSPLSPAYKPSPFDTLQPPSPRSLHARAVTTAAAASSTTRRTRDASLKLPSLPRFHPAQFPSGRSSLQTTPLSSSEGSTPGTAAAMSGPVSPRAHQRMLSTAQKQLLTYQREVVAAAQRGVVYPAGVAGLENPESPRLAPLGSPGPVLTPLELEAEEEEDGYLVAGATRAHVPANEEDLVERLIGEENRRMGSPISRLRGRE